MSTSSITHEIDYAPTPPWHRRRWVGRTCWIAAIIALAATAPWWWPRAYERAKLLISQRHCMIYRAPPGLIVLETDSNRITALNRSSPNYTLDHADLIYAAPEFSAFFQAIWSPNLNPMSSVFLHSRTNSAGGKRLVVVIAVPFHDVLDDPDASLVLEADVIFPATPLRIATESRTQLGVNYRRLFGLERVYAGQPDPNDLSHFTFTVVTHEKTLHFDGWLRDDDTVKLEPREGYPSPETFPASTEPATALPAR